MSSSEGLQVVPDSGIGQNNESPIPVAQNSIENKSHFEVETGDGNSTGKRILGMRQRIFWVVLAIMVIVIFGAVGGAFAGGAAYGRLAFYPVITSSMVEK